MLSTSRSTQGISLINFLIYCIPHFAIVLNANKYCSTLCISEVAYPFLNFNVREFGCHYTIQLNKSIQNTAEDNKQYNNYR